MKMSQKIALAVMTSLPLLGLSVSAAADILSANGTITLLRVHDVGTGYGPPGDTIDGEVIMQISSRPGQAFGFALREDGNRAVRQGMLDLLRDAFNNNWTVTIVYDIDPGDNNGIIFRAWLTKP